MFRIINSFPPSAFLLRGLYSRVKELGFEAAKGAYNYANNKRVSPFAFAPGSSKGGRTFIISIKDAARLYVSDTAFRNLLNAGRYIYVDGHFCVDDPRYVIHRIRTVRMTEWAITHVDECCLRFVKRYVCVEKTEYYYGQLFSDEAFNEQKLSFFPNENSMTLRQYVSAVQSFARSLPDEFSKALVVAMKTRNVTIEQLASISGIPVRTIERLRARPYKHYDMERVVILCLALNLPTDVSLCMLKKAGLNLGDSEDDMVYEFLLRQMYGSDFDYIVPQSIVALGESYVDLFKSQMRQMGEWYHDWLDVLGEKEDARFVLPNACATRMIVTMNTREQLHFFEQRCCNRAQWEIRAVAWEMLRLVREVAPALFVNAGPSCTHGACSQGNMSCNTPYQQEGKSDDATID